MRQGVSSELTIHAYALQNFMSFESSKMNFKSKDI